jgi:hypothetical protein
MSDQRWRMLLAVLSIVLPVLGIAIGIVLGQWLAQPATPSNDRFVGTSLI